jgi:hypothetical protein
MEFLTRISAPLIKFPPKISGPGNSGLGGGISGLGENISMKTVVTFAFELRF